MTTKITIDTKQWDRNQARLIRKMKNVRPVLDKVADGEVRDAQRRIRSTKMDPDGNPWPAAAYSTIQAGASKGRRGLLYVSGLLYKSFTKKTTRTTMEVKNTQNYAGYHNEGIGQKKRTFLGFSDDSVKRITDLFKKHLRI